MQTTKFILCLSILAYSVSPAHSNEISDLKNFEYAGVKLGDAPEDAMANLAEYFSFDPVDFEIQRDSSDPVSKLRNQIVRITYRSDTINIKADFGPDVRNTPIEHNSLDRLEYTRISEKEGKKPYRIRGGAETEKMHLEAIEIYGEPSLKTDSTSFKWCVNISDDGKECHEESPGLRIHTGIFLDGGYAVLEDPVISIEWYKEYDKL